MLEGVSTPTPPPPPPPPQRRRASAPTPDAGKAKSDPGEKDPTGAPKRSRDATARAAAGVSTAAGLAGKAGLGRVASAASTLADPNATAGQKATEAAAAGAEAAVTAVVGAAATPLAGKVAGAVVGTGLRNKKVRNLLVALLMVPLLGIGMLVLGTALLTQQVGALVAAAAGEEEEQGGGAGGGAVPDGYCYAPGPGNEAVLTLTQEQSTNARAIVAAVSARDLGARDAVIAVMTALTESSLINVAYGDEVGPDSRGLFQQRDSWGTLEERMDPSTATGLFLDAMLSPNLQVFGSARKINTSESSRGTFEPWMVAQSVQRSAFSDGSNYQGHYSQAVGIVRTLLGDAAASVVDPWMPSSEDDPEFSAGACSPGEGAELPPSERAAAAIAFAKAQVGKSYVWGAAGPNTFDCSGLTMRAYEAAGVNITRTTRTQYAWAVKNARVVDLADAQPGDLIYYTSDPTKTDIQAIYHVAMYLGDDTIVHAPKPGDVVKIAPIYNKPALMPLAVRP